MVSVRSEMIDDLDRRRDRGLQHRQHRLDPVDRLDDIGAGLALDGQDDRPLLVVPAGDQIVLRRRRSAWPMSRMRTGEPLR